MRAESQNQAIPIDVGSEHVLIEPAHLREGENEISFRFAAGDAALNRNPDFMYTLVRAGARTAGLSVLRSAGSQSEIHAVARHSSGWEALANAPEIERIKQDARQESVLRRSDPLPTYLFAFAAGRYQIETAERNGRRFRMFHRETDAAKVARNRDAIFDLHAAALDWLEQYTAIKYPFGKFDFLLVPSFQFGGMEHAGAIFYNASGLLLDESATQNQKLGRASVIAHETAHMWFGDLVTMRWFNDVWMKEVFANFMAAKIVNPSFPGINHELRFLLSYYPAAYEVDRTAGTNAIRQRLDNLSDAGTLYGAIIYQKAPIVMRQLEMILGADWISRWAARLPQRTPVRERRRWPDLIKVLDEEHPTISRRGVTRGSKKPAAPTSRPISRSRKGESPDLRFERRIHPRRGLFWTAAHGSHPRLRRHDTTDSDHAEQLTRRAHHRPRSYRRRGLFCPPAAGIAYGGFDIDPVTREYLLHHLGDISDALTRGSAMVTLWEDMLDGRARAADVVEQLISAVAARTGRAEPAADAVLHRAGLLAIRLERRTRRTDAAARTHPARGTRLPRRRRA